MRDERYEKLIERLCHQSVVKHYDAFVDVPWDDPACAIEPLDPRWELTDDSPLGQTAWYRSQSQATRAAIGLEQMMGHTRFGLEFESVLKRGLLEFATTLPNGAPEFRYVYHEVIEEAQHSLMFHELIRRSGIDTPGLSSFHRSAARRVVDLGRRFPELFFMFVLGGEEPIDHVQRNVLRERADEVHPLLRKIMQIHITEEARHLCFARAYLRQHVPRLSAWKRWRLRIAVPAILGEMARLMLQPPSFVIERHHIPEEVVREAYIDNPSHKAAVLDSVGNIRKLCEELDVLTPATVPVWRKVGIYSPK